MGILQKLYYLLCGPKLLNYVLPVTMLYLTIGTIAQKYIGLYEATKIFFANPIIWLGFVPLPGMPVFMALIFLNMAFKLLFKSPWNWKQSGIILTHIGALLLLLGGLFTALFSNEGNLALAVGETKSMVSDYHQRALTITDKNGEKLKEIDRNTLEKGQTLSFKGIPFQIELLESCQHCTIIAQDEKTENHKDLAQHMKLQSAPLRKNSEENLSGLTFQIKHPENASIYTILEDVPKLPTITIEDKSYTFALGKAKRPLPFTVQLLDFKKEVYPGTDKAKSYESKVLIQDGTMQWESMISMNKPLRYKGYTLFQSSFIDTKDADISVFAVVWNVGRAFPYISGLAMCLGLILHLLLRNQNARKNKKGAANA